MSLVVNPSLGIACITAHPTISNAYKSRPLPGAPRMLRMVLKISSRCKLDISEGENGKNLSFRFGFKPDSSFGKHSATMNSVCIRSCIHIIISFSPLPCLFKEQCSAPMAFLLTLLTSLMLIQCSGASATATKWFGTVRHELSCSFPWLFLSDFLTFFFFTFFFSLFF